MPDDNEMYERLDPLEEVTQPGSKRVIKEHEWVQVGGVQLFTSESLDGTYTMQSTTQRMKVPSGWLYREVLRVQVTGGVQSISLGTPVFVWTGK